jgi:hypothetical protein
VTEDSNNDFYWLCYKNYYQRREGEELTAKETADLLGADTLNLPFLFYRSSFFILPSISRKNFSSIKGEAKLLS